MWHSSGCEASLVSVPFMWPCPGSRTAGCRGCGGCGGGGTIDTLDVLVGAIKVFALTGMEADVTI